MQPEMWGIAPDYVEDVYAQTALDSSEHVTGNKNRAFGVTTRISVGMWQWIIVAAALGLLWAGHFHFRSVFKAVV